MQRASGVAEACRWGEGSAIGREDHRNAGQGRGAYRGNSYSMLEVEQL